MTLRNFFILPLAISAVLMYFGVNLAVYATLTLASVGFNFFRGMAMLGQNPTLAIITSNEKDRSLYLAITVVIVYLFTIFSNLLLTLVLHISNDSLLGYALILLAGTVLGVVAGYQLLLIPKTDNEPTHSSVFTILKGAYKRFAFRQFIITYFFVSLVMAFTRPFIVVYAKGPYEQSDSNAMLLTTIAALGSMFMGIFARTIINLVGSKTLFIFFMAVSTLSLIPAIISPTLDSSSLFLFLAIFHFISAFGMQGVESNSQTYLFTVIRPDEVVELSIIYYVVYGISGAIGSTLGGMVLDFLPHHLSSVKVSFQLYFAIALATYIIVLGLLMNLKNTGRHSVRDGLGFILSLKDMKAINLANKLENSGSATKQSELLQSLAKTDSDAPIELIIESLQSPRLFVRRDALFALESIPPTKNPELADALLRQLRHHTSSTAYIAARILGRNGIKKALPALRVAASSPDNYLKAESIRALGSLKDKNSLNFVLNHIKPDENPYVSIQAINALEQLCSIEQVTLLFRPFKWKEPLNPALANEAIISSSVLLDIKEWFYTAYIAFLKNRADGYAMLSDPYIDMRKKLGRNNELEQLLNQPKVLDYYKLMKSFLQNNPFLPHESEKLSKLLTCALLNPVLFRHRKIRFLFTAIALSSYLSGTTTASSSKSKKGKKGKK